MPVFQGLIGYSNELTKAIFKNRRRCRDAYFIIFITSLFFAMYKENNTGNGVIYTHKICSLHQSSTCIKQIILCIQKIPRNTKHALKALDDALKQQITCIILLL